MGGPKKDLGWQLVPGRGGGSAREAVQRAAALALQGVDDVHGVDGAAAGVLSVAGGVGDHCTQEVLEDLAAVLVYQPVDALHTSLPRQPPDLHPADAPAGVSQELLVAVESSLAAAAADARGRNSNSRFYHQVIHADVVVMNEVVEVETCLIYPPKFDNRIRRKIGQSETRFQALRSSITKALL